MLPEQGLLLAAGAQRVQASLQQGSGEGQEQPGTNLSKISCSARWGKGEKESSPWKSPQVTSQTQPGHSNPGTLLPPTEATLHPSTGLGSSRVVPQPFSSAAALSAPQLRKGVGMAQGHTSAAPS